MERKQALIELREMVSRGDWDGLEIIPHRATTVLSWAFSEENIENVVEADSGNIAAALEIHEAELPGWDWIITNEGRHAGNPPGPLAAVAKDPEGDDLLFRASGETPARAWLLAIIDALIAQEAPL